MTCNIYIHMNKAMHFQLLIHSKTKLLSLNWMWIYLRENFVVKWWKLQYCRSCIFDKLMYMIIQFGYRSRLYNKVYLIWHLTTWIDLNQIPHSREKTKSEFFFQQWPRGNNFLLIIYHFSSNKSCMTFFLASRDVLYEV